MSIFVHVFCNSNGNTFLHILLENKESQTTVIDNICSKLTRNMNRINPNLKNNNDETIISLMLKNYYYLINIIFNLFNNKDKAGNRVIDVNLWCNGESYLHLV